MPVVTRAQKKKMDVMDNMTDAQLVRLLVAEKLAEEAIETLKQRDEENKQLKEELEDASRHAEIWSSVEAEDSYNELREENKQLKEQLKFANHLREASHQQDYRAQERCRERLATIKKLEEENKKLKDANATTLLEMGYTELYRDMKEIKKLKEERDDYRAIIDFHSDMMDGIVDAVGDEEEVAEIQDVKIYIKNLKEENENLKEDILEMGAEINKRCAGELMFHQTPDGENCLIEIHK